MKPKETLDKAYGNVPKEVGWHYDFTILPTWRGFKFYFFKLRRFLTR